MKRMQKTLALCLCATLSLWLPASALAQGTTPEKEESVYILLNADGSVQSQSVSCWLHSEGGLSGVTDQSTLTQIENLKSDITPHIDGQTLVWDTSEPDVYYTGKTDKTPPVSLSLSYTLNGAPIAAQQLMGKSGHVSIAIHMENHEKQTRTVAGRQRTVYTPFVVALMVDLPNAQFQNVKSAQSDVISDDTHQLVSFIGAPGLKQSFDGVLTGELGDVWDEWSDTLTIEADVTDFVFPTIMGAVANNLVELKEMNLNDTVSKLGDGMDQLLTASAQLQEGTGLLQQAMQTFDGKLGELKSSYSEFNTQLQNALTGVDELKSGAASLAGAINALKAKATDELVPGLQGSTALQKQLVQKMQALQKQLNGLTLPDLGQLQAQLQSAIVQVSNGSADAALQITQGITLKALLASSDPAEAAQGQALQKQLAAIQKQAGEQVQKALAQVDLRQLQALEASLTEIDSLSSALMGQMSKLQSALYSENDDLHNPKTLVGAILALSIGGDTVKDGMAELNAGVHKLATASTRVEAAVSALKQASGQLRQKTGELNDGMTAFKQQGVDALCQTDLIDQLDTALAIKDAMQLQSDAYGSYTGTPKDGTCKTAFILKVMPPEQSQPTGILQTLLHAVADVAAQQQA